MAGRNSCEQKLLSPRIAIRPQRGRVSNSFYYFLSLWKESNQRKHTEETEVSSGSFLGALKVSFGNTRIGIKGAASATISLAPGAARGVRYDSDTLRKQGAIGGNEISNKYMLCAAVGLIARRCQVHPLQCVTPWSRRDALGVACVSASRIDGVARQPNEVKQASPLGSEAREGGE